MPHQYEPRVDSTQLPSAPELLDILRQESPRQAVRFDFIQKNKAIYDIFRKLSKLANSDDSWIDTYQDLSLEMLDAKIVRNHDELARYIIEHQDEPDLYVDFYNALVPKVELKNAEAIFVFGAATNARIERAVELYEEGIAPKIIISGDSPHYVDGKRPEASRMATYAIQHGVTGENLILEENSITLPDNVKRTIDLLEEMNWRPSSLVIIATNFVLTRAQMEWYKFCPWDIEIIPVAAHPQSDKFTPEGWSKDQDTIDLVLNEYAKIIFESKIDLMRRDRKVS